MAYFTSRHTTTSTEQTCEIGNKDEKQPLLSDGLRSHYYTTLPKQSTGNTRPIPYSSSCTTPTDGTDILLPPFKRLAHLRRTTWSDLSNGSASPIDQLYEDAPTPIQLPSFQLSPPHDSTSFTQNGTIAYELHWMITWALFLCLLCPIGATVIVFTSTEVNNNRYTWIQQSLQPLLAVFWSLLVVFWKHHPEKIQSFLRWTQNTCIVTMLSLFSILALFDATPEYIYILVVVLSISLCLFYVARRLDIAAEQQHLCFQQHLRDQHSFAQRLINDQNYMHTQKRLTFLSTVTNEIQDAVLMILATLEQFSPTMVLNNTQELLSACSIAVPITGIGAIHTTLKQVHHISSHLQLMFCLIQESNHSDNDDSNNNNNNNNNKNGVNDNSCETDASSTSTQIQTTNNSRSQLRQPFDIGDLLQNASDALAGMASKLDVNMVLYHFDNKLHHTRVIGDENAFRHALLNLLRNILEGSTPGACIEVGLNLVPVVDNNDKMTVILDTIHTCSPAIPEHLSSTSILLPNANLTSQLIRYIGGQLSIYNLSNRRTRFEMVVEMELAGNSDDHVLFLRDTPTHATGTNTPLLNSYQHIKFANEPTMKDLSKFMENLKGLKMVLHAKEQSVFAKHLTGCLASWNSDISHVPVSRLDDGNGSMLSENNRTPDSDGNTSSSTPPISTSATESILDYQQRQQQHHNHNHPHHRQHQLYSTTPSTTTPGATSAGSTSSSKMSSRPSSTNMPPVPSPATEEEHLLSIPPAFILIDDNIMTLEHKLLEFRTHPPVSSATTHSRRHKHMKSNQTTHHHGPTTAIIHFTSLINYKRVRDTIQWASTLSTPFAMPRLIVVPKPAGPRRYLTALHTVWHEAMVEPHFIPIATSPGSPVPTVLLSSMLSQVIEQPSSITPPTPNSDRLLSSNQQHHRPRRPTNGTYSPPSMYIHQQQQQEGSNYFFDRSGAGGNLVQQTSTGSHLHTLDNKGLRRRSLKEISEAMSQGSETKSDNDNNNNSSSNNGNSSALESLLDGAATTLSPLRQMTPLPSSSTTMNPETHGLSITVVPDGSTMTTSVASKSGSTTTSTTATAAEIGIDSNISLSTGPTTNTTSVCGSSLEGTLPLAHLPIVTSTTQDQPLLSASSPSTVDTTTMEPKNNNSNNNNNSSSNSNSNNNNSSSSNNNSSTSPPSPDHLSENKPKSETTKRMSRMASIKLNKRKKKEKGSPFANVVSPPINVLIVEDNIINQAILSAWMKKHKIKFSVASNGQEAVEKWKGGGFHLILMDIQLPVMSGIDATKTIRSIEKEQKIGVLPMSSSFLRQQQQRQANDFMDTSTDTTDMIHPTASPSPTLSTPSPTSLTSATSPDSQLLTTPSTFRSPVIIVALTASSLESDRHAALAAGCNDFLTKPVSLEWLEKKIIEWGCMQALIDFEGWRRWKRSTHDDDVSSWANKVSMQGSGSVGADASMATPSSSSSSYLHRNGRLATPGIHTLGDGGGGINGRSGGHRVSIRTDALVGQASLSGHDTLSPLPPPSAGSVTSMISNISSHMVDNSGSESDGRRKGILLPGAVGLNKRRFSTVDKQSLRRHNTTSGNHYHHQQQHHSPYAPINRTTSFSKLPIQKSHSESVTNIGIRRKVTKKAVSMDDTMRTPTSVG